LFTNYTNCFINIKPLSKGSYAKIKIWITADERMIPVKLASKVVVGSFVGELVSIEQMPIK